jgi:hypothetical protein
MKAADDVNRVIRGNRILSMVSTGDHDRQTSLRASYILHRESLPVYLYIQYDISHVKETSLPTNWGISHIIETPLPSTEVYIYRLQT